MKNHTHRHHTLARTCALAWVIALLGSTSGCFALLQKHNDNRKLETQESEVAAAREDEAALEALLADRKLASEPRTRAKAYLLRLRVARLEGMDCAAFADDPDANLRSLLQGVPSEKRYAVAGRLGRKAVSCDLHELVWSRAMERFGGSSHYLSKFLAEVGTEEEVTQSAVAALERTQQEEPLAVRIEVPWVTRWLTDHADEKVCAKVADAVDGAKRITVHADLLSFYTAKGCKQQVNALGRSLLASDYPVARSRMCAALAKTENRKYLREMELLSFRDPEWAVRKKCRGAVNQLTIRAGG